MVSEKNLPRVAAAFVLLAVVLVAVMLGMGSPAAQGAAAPYMSTLFGDDHVLTVDLHIDESTWEGLLENAMAEEYVVCDAVIDGTTLDRIAIRTKGNSSLNMVVSSDSDRYSFKLDFDKYIDGQNLDGLTQLVLNNVIGDATYMKEYLSYDLLSEMGIKTPGHAFARVSVNGEYWGLYQAVEPVNEEFLTRWYGMNYGNLYKPESTGNMGGVDKGGFRDFEDAEQFRAEWQQNRENLPDKPAVREFSERESISMQPEERGFPGRGNAPVPGERPMGDGGAPQLPDGGRAFGGRMGDGTTSLVYTDDALSSYTGIFDGTKTDRTTEADQRRLVSILKRLNEGGELDDVIDVDEVLRYFAVNTFLVNMDSYAGALKHNYYLYESGGRIEILPWDYNLAFGAHELRDAASVVNFPIDAPVTDTMENSPLIAKLLENEQYKARYHAYLREIVDRFVKTNWYAARITKLNGLIAESVETDPTAFYTGNEYRAALEQLSVYFVDRARSIEAQLDGAQPTTEYGSLETALELAALGSNEIHGLRGQTDAAVRGERP